MVFGSILMGHISSVAPTPAAFSRQIHFQALIRSAAIGVAGLAVWGVVACSSTPPVEGPTTGSEANEPEWTYRGALGFSAMTASRPTTIPSSCYID
jgi:hypothetical protein